MKVSRIETLRREFANQVFVMFHTDEWLTGLDEAKKIGARTEPHHLPVAPKDCTGPVVWTASTHLSVNLPNAPIQESAPRPLPNLVRGARHEPPTVSDRHISSPDGPGLGTEPLPGLREHRDSHLLTSRLQGS